MRTRLSRTIVRTAPAWAVALSTGCATTGGSSSSSSAGSPPAVSGEPVLSTHIDARPAAVVNGRTLAWGDLKPALNEAAGALVLEERILDDQLLRALIDAGVTIGETERVAEQQLLLDSLDEDEDTAWRLLEQLRTRRGLGPVRYRALLDRNAGLRALVRDRVQVTSDMIARTYELVHGPKRQARLITVPTARDADRIRRQLVDGASFVELAVAESTDVSAARGGLLEPISRLDTAYPDALRQALYTLQPQGLSQPILLDQQFAILQHVRTFVDEDVPALGDVRDAMARLARLEQERLLMDDLARRLIADVAVTIFDRSLQDVWDRRRGAAW